MKIDKMVNNITMFLYLYRLHARKLLKKIENEDAKALLLISYKEDDILELLNEIIQEREIFKDLVEKNELDKAYRLYKDIEYKYKLAENILTDRIEELVKIRAFDIMKSNH
ncbi:MAG: hypothetical protein ACP5GJ_01410 [Nanopusillaceae archaeon]|jgi:hypothetical protein